MEFFHPILNRVKWGQGHTDSLDHHIFVRKAYIPNLIPLVPFLHVEKFVVGGGGGVKVDFSVKFKKPKLNNCVILFLQFCDKVMIISKYNI